MEIKKTKFQLLILVSLLVLFVWAGWTAWQNNQTRRYIDNIDSSQYELSDLLTKVRQHMELPDSVPLIAVIDHAEPLIAEQPFYNNSQDGDLLLIFAELSVIYRPSEDKIINSGPVIFAQK